MSTSTLCRLVGITEHMLRGMILSGKVPRPEVEAGRFIWPDSAVEVVKAAALVDLRRVPRPEVRFPRVMS